LLSNTNNGLQLRQADEPAPLQVKQLVSQAEQVKGVVILAKVPAGQLVVLDKH